METVLYHDPLPLADPTGLKHFFLTQGVQMRVVPASQLHQTLGHLAGLEGCPARPAPTTPARVGEPVMVFCGFPRDRLDQVLDAMKAASAPRCLKAVLTATNRAWPFARLCAELQSEREEIAKAARKQGG